MTEIEKMETLLTTHHYKATSSSGGSARNAQRARCTAGRLAHANGPHAKGHQDVLVVPGRSFVTATL